MDDHIVTQGGSCPAQDVMTIKVGDLGLDAALLAQSCKRQASAKAEVQCIEDQKACVIRAMDAIQRLACTVGNSEEIRASIDAVAATATTEEDFGSFANVIKTSKDMALEILTKALEQAMHMEGEAFTAELEQAARHAIHQPIVTDEEIIERVGSAYNWNRADTLARIKKIKFDEVTA